MNVFVFFFNYVEVAVAWVLGSLCGTIFFKHNICMYSIEYLWKINYDMEHLTPKKKKNYEMEPICEMEYYDEDC